MASSSGKDEGELITFLRKCNIVEVIANRKSFSALFEKLLSKIYGDGNTDNAFLKKKNAYLNPIQTAVRCKVSVEVIKLLIPLFKSETAKPDEFHYLVYFPIFLLTISLFKYFLSPYTIRCVTLLQWMWSGSCWKVITHPENSILLLPEKRLLPRWYMLSITMHLTRSSAWSSNAAQSIFPSRTNIYFFLYIMQWWTADKTTTSLFFIVVKIPRLMSAKNM